MRIYKSQIEGAESSAAQGDLICFLNFIPRKFFF
jgi:hypothetical protein